MEFPMVLSDPISIPKILMPALPAAAVDIAAAPMEFWGVISRLPEGINAGAMAVPPDLGSIGGEKNRRGHVLHDTTQTPIRFHPKSSLHTLF